MEELSKEFLECKQSFFGVKKQLNQKDDIILKQKEETKDVKLINRKLKKELKEKLSSKDSKNMKLVEKNTFLESEIQNLGDIIAEKEKLIRSMSETLSNQAHASKCELVALEEKMSVISKANKSVTTERDNGLLKNSTVTARLKVKSAHCAYYKWWNIVLRKKLQYHADKVTESHKMDTDNLDRIKALESQLKSVEHKLISTPREDGDGKSVTNHSSLLLEYIDDSYTAMEDVDNSFLDNISCIDSDCDDQLRPELMEQLDEGQIEEVTKNITEFKAVQRDALFELEK